jgi:hypothetical protein
MKPEEAKAVVDTLLTQGQEACDAAKKAAKHRASLKGDNFYGKKFHSAIISLSQTYSKLKRVIAAVDLEESDADRLSSNIEIIKSTSARPTQRTQALKQIQFVCQSELLARIENLSADPVPETEQVLPMAVVQGTRGYIERVVLQANGCYEHEWLDACAVMIRRLVETLIIEVYEKHKKEAEIQDHDRNYLMLSHLVGKILDNKSWNLGRETRSSLPQLKSLGDRSAHNRRYLAKKRDIDNVLPGLRVVVDDLLHLASLK